MIVQRNGLVPKLSNEEVLLLDFFLERPQPLQLILSGLESFVGLCSSRVCSLEPLPELLELGIRTFCEFTELLFTGWKSSDSAS